MYFFLGIFSLSHPSPSHYRFFIPQNKIGRLLVLDRAGWHISHQLKLPEGLNLFFLPAHSPELQPAERLWPLTNEVVANHTPRSLSELEELLVIRCQKLLKQQDLVKGLTCYHWWPITRAV